MEIVEMECVWEFDFYFFSMCDIFLNFLSQVSNVESVMIMENKWKYDFLK